MFYRESRLFSECTAKGVMDEAWITELLAKDEDYRILDSIDVSHEDAAKIKAHLVCSLLAFMIMLAEGMGLEGEERANILMVSEELLAEFNAAKGNVANGPE